MTPTEADDVIQELRSLAAKARRNPKSDYACHRALLIKVYGKMIGAETAPNLAASKEALAGNRTMRSKTKRSAGLLLFRRKGESLEVFLVHPGGPFWARKEDAAWSIPKGEFDDEQPLAAAVREFQEETGIIPKGEFLELKPAKQPSGKTIYAWALEMDCDAGAIRSNTFAIQWPRGIGQLREFPEVDRAAWFTLPQAKKKLVPGQLALLDQLAGILS